MVGMALSLVSEWMKQYPMMIHCTQLSDRWHYEHGCLLKGIADVYDYTSDNRLLEYIQVNIDRYVEDDGNIRTYRAQDYNLDHIHNGKILLMLYRNTGEHKYALAAQHLIRQLDNQPRTQSGGFWHKKIYPHQMWLDGHYMAMPFLAEYGTLFNERKYIDEAVFQLLLMEKNARDPKSGLLYHGFDESRCQRWSDPFTGRSPQIWGMGMGWFSMALADTLPFLREHELKEAVAAAFTRCANAVIRMQDDETGLWYQVMNQGGKSGNYLESSASSMFIYALKKGYHMGILDQKMEEAALLGYQGLKKHLITKDRNGMMHIKQNCKASGLGGQPYRDGSYNYYISEPVVEDDPKSIGACIMALGASEYF